MMTTPHMIEQTTEFMPHVPQLIKYGMRLTGSRDRAERLVFSTLDAAQKKRWKKTDHVPVDAWLSMLMVQEHMNPATSGDPLL